MLRRIVSDDVNTLLQLYQPEHMPAEWVKSHCQLDKAVHAAYDYTDSREDTERTLMSAWEARQPLT